MNKQIITKELTEIYLENYLSLEKEQYKRNYNLDEITRYYLSIYKQILKILTNEIIFNNKINQLVYSISLIHLKKYIKENTYDDIDLYTKEFIISYKYISKEIDKDYTLKELLKESASDPKKSIQTKTYKK